MKRYIYLAVLVSLLVLSACTTSEKDAKDSTNDVKYEGFIIHKQNRNGLQILVMNGVKKEDIQNMTLDELIKRAKDEHSAVYFFVNEDEYKNLKVGQKVAVWYEKGQPQMESNPPQTDMKKVEVIED